MASRISGITVEIGGDTTKLQTALKSVNTEIKSTETQLKDVEKLLKLDPTNTELLAQKQALLSKAIAETSDKLNTLKLASQQANTALANGEISQQQYDALQREIIATEQALESLTTRANESYTALQQMANAGESMKTLGTNIENVGNKLAPVSAAVTALGTGAVVTAANFESSMSKVQATLGITTDSMSILNGESVNTMDALSDLAKQMGTETEHSANSCAEAIDYLALAGYETQQIFDTLPMVLDLASSGKMDLASASDMLTDSMSALGLEVTDAETMVDQMAKTSQKSNTSVEQLGEAILTIGGTAKTMAGGTAELNTALGILADNGAKGSEGGTTLRNILLSLQTPTDKARAMMEELGVAVYDSDGEFRELNSILGDFNSSMEDMTSEEKSNVIATIFNTTDIKSVNDLLANTGDSWDNLQQSITDSAGTASQMAETQLDNLQGQLTILKSALEGLAISLGEILLPVIKNMATSLQTFVDWLNNLDDGTKNVIVGVGLFVAALAPVLIIVGKVTTAIGSILTLAPKLGTAITAVKTAFSALNLTMLANPVGLIIAGITALVAAFAYLWTTSEAFRDFWGVVWSSIQNILYTVCLAIVTFQEETWLFITNTISNASEMILGGIAVAWQTITDILYAVCLAIVTLQEETWLFIINTINNASEMILGGIAIAWQTITDILYAVCLAIVTLQEETWLIITNTISNASELILGGIAIAWQTIKDILYAVCLEIVTFQEETWLFITNTISNASETILGGVATAWQTIKTSISNSLETIKTSIYTGWETIKTTFATALTTISSGVSTSFTNMLSGITGTMGNIFTAIKSGLDNGVNYIKTLISQSYTWGVDLISGMVQGIRNSISAVTSAVKDVANTIWSYLHFTVPEVGPLTDYETWMPDFMEGLAKGINSSKSMVTNAMDGLASDMVISPQGQISTDSITSNSGSTGFDVSSLVSGITSALQGTMGDITIPVSIGQNMLEEIVITAQQRMNLKSGGH